MSTTLAPRVLTSTATGFYLRNNLADQGGDPLAAPFDQSPDILHSASPVSQPQATFSTASSWAEAYDTAPTAGENYYYARGRNDGDQAVVPQISLFAAPAQLIAWPSLWTGAPLTTADGKNAVVLDSVAPGAIGVTPQPFTWTPPQSLGGSSFAMLVAWSTSALKPQAPPAATSFADMAALLTSTPGLAFNQMTTLDADDGPWVVRTGLVIPAEVTDCTGISFLLTGRGLNGATVAMVAEPFPDSRQLLELAPQVLPDGAVIGTSALLQPGFEGTLAVQIWPGATAPVAGASLTLQAIYVVPPGQIERAAARGTLTPAGRHLSKLGVTPQAASPLGEFTIVFSQG